MAIFGAGLTAGTINAVIGSGSLVTFPTLLALGYAPVVANVSNTVGLVPGSLSAAYGYRRELRGQRGRVLRLGVASTLGALTGGILLLLLPADAFERVVPFMLLAACGLMAAQPRLSRLLPQVEGGGREGGLAMVAVFATGVYGGYFGAAQGVMLIALLAVFVPDDLQRLNGLKNALVSGVNGVTALLFLAIAPVAWEAAALIAFGSIVGGLVGAHFGRTIPAGLLRILVISVGCSVAVWLLLR
ncbi:MAG TPA: sulfite exporter TauE/SafE family protein [Candidatus Limnocylindria bacterium]|nr:sulfite exporter TauE/SafE family protein [Candidatus Limnocylindria bacterium]